MVINCTSLMSVLTISMKCMIMMKMSSMNIIIMAICPRRLELSPLMSPSSLPKVNEVLNTRSDQRCKGLSDKFLMAEKVDNKIGDSFAFCHHIFFVMVFLRTKTRRFVKIFIGEVLTKSRVKPGMWRRLKAQI